MKIGDLCMIYKPVPFDEAQITGIDLETATLFVTTTDIHEGRNNFKARMLEYGNKYILLIVE